MKTITNFKFEIYNDQFESLLSARNLLLKFNYYLPIDSRQKFFGRRNFGAPRAKHVIIFNYVGTLYIFIFARGRAYSQVFSMLGDDAFHTIVQFCVRLISQARSRKKQVNLMLNPYPIGNPN